MLPDHIKSSGWRIPRPAPWIFSPAAAVAADHGVHATMPLVLPYERDPIVFGATADSLRLPHARFLPPLIFQQQNARGYYAGRLCPTKQSSR